MELELTRFKKSAEGVLSYLLDASGEQICVTATHAYEQPSGLWDAKVLPGRYLCKRGVHELANGVPFSTFEITGVPGHTGILFHKGNLPEVDSEGCELVGKAFGTLDGDEAVLESADAFASFMQWTEGTDDFWLTVT
jgi:Family of unknown function (DUF5675)